MTDSIPVLRPVQATPPAAENSRPGFGASVVDDWLKGGLRRNGVHEFHAAAGEDRGAAAALALLLSVRACSGAPVMWFRVTASRQHERPFAPGLAGLGLDPGSVVLAELPDAAGLLKAAVDSVRHGGLGAGILELDGRAAPYDLTASRRLALAAERSGTMVLVVRSGAEPGLSAAHTRWRVASAPSIPLAANAPGHPAFDLTLLRQRGGREGLHVQLEWDREQACFRTPLPGGAPAVPAGGPADRRAPQAA
ncbi:MAG: hypothetical protein KGL48_04675 [Sphingomonadales bacterium]|nr:hypothetical protein [Sphingomonadales bacterium]MDE2567522.1 hypothetical protein [Sphingomonadales bacterium]